MRVLKQPDTISGFILIVFGLAQARYSATHYPLGTWREIGSGMFPTAIGVMIAALGALVMISAFTRDVKFPSFEWISFAAVISSLAAFGFGTIYLGLVPAIIAMTIISGFGSGEGTFFRKLILSVVLATFAAVAFRYGLGIQIPLFRF